jgi:hypothetical protein
MPARSVARAALALLFAGLAVATPAAAQPAPVPTVEADRACPSNDITVTIDNPTQATYQVTIEIGPITPTQEPPFETIQETIDPGEVFTTTFEGMGDVALVVAGDGDFPDYFADPWFMCARTLDIAVTTPESTPVLIEFQGPCAGPTDTPNATIEQVDNFTIRYIPDPGFVGVEAFHYSCASSASLEGTVTVTVIPAQAPPAAPVPEAPTFTG